MNRTVERMLRTNPEPPFAPLDALGACIHACMESEQVCTANADACIADHMPQHLDACIRRSLDCADICATTARILSRQRLPDLEVIAILIELCATACDACARECDRHAPWHAHCGVCAAACHRCYVACRTIMTGGADALRH